jgi:hypothetical protein
VRGAGVVFAGAVKLNRSSILEEEVLALAGVVAGVEVAAPKRVSEAVSGAAETGAGVMAAGMRRQHE